MTTSSLFRSTLQVTSFSALNIVLGFANQLVVAYYFGATLERDSYFAAAVIPLYISTLFAGSVGVMFMSSYIEHQTRRTAEERDRFTNSVLNISATLLFVLAVAGIVLSDSIIRLLLPGFGSTLLQETSGIFRILLPSTIFLVLSNLLSTIYQAHGRFVPPAATPLVNVVITLGCVLIWHGQIGIVSLAWGTLAGSIVQFMLLVPIVRTNHAYIWRATYDRDIKKIFMLAAPLFFAGIFYRSSTIFERMIASTLERGSISYLGYATQLMNYLSIIATGGIATTIFPVMTKGWELGDLDMVRNYFAKGIRIVLTVTVPIAVVFIVMGEPVIRIIFERGAFDSHTTAAVSKSLAVMMVAFVCLSCGNIVAKGFYLSNKTKLFSVIVSVEVVIYLSLGYYLSSQISYVGLAVALSVSSLSTFVISSVFLHKIFKGVNAGRLMYDILKVGTASVVLGAVVLTLRSLTFGNMPELLAVIISGGIGVAVYIVVTCSVLPIEEMILAKKKIFAFIENRVLRIGRK